MIQLCKMEQKWEQRKVERMEPLMVATMVALTEMMTAEKWVVEWER